MSILAALKSFVDLILTVWDYWHDKGQQQIGSQNQVMKNLEASNTNAEKWHETAEKVDSMDVNTLDADLARRMSDGHS